MDNSTTTPVKDFLFSDLFNLEDIQRLQDLFSDSTGVASIITHPDGTPITRPSNFCRFCTLIRATEKGRANCYKSDAVLGRQDLSGPVLQPCLSGGLWDGGASISVGGKHIANWLIGQVRSDALDEEQMLRYAEEIGLDGKELLEALNEVTIMPIEQFRKVSAMLFAFSAELSEKAYTNWQLKNQGAEREKISVQLKDSEERFQLLFNKAPMGYQSLDIDGCFIEVNQQWLDTLGYARREVIGKWFGDFLTPAYQEGFRKRFPVFKEQGHIHSEFEMVHKNGCVLFIAFDGKIGYDEEGHFKQTHCILQDISERIKSERQLQESHDLLSNLARLVPGVVYQYRLYPDGRSAFPYSSPGMYDIYEVTPDEVREDATPVFGRLHPEDAARVSELIFDSARTLQTFYCEFRVILPQQGLRWRWSQAHPERTPDGGTLWHGIISDITDQKEAQEAIYRSNKDWEDSFDSISDMITIHDLDYNIVRSNSAAKALLKLPEQGSLLYSKCFSHYHGSDAPPAGCPSCRCLVSGKPGIFEMFEPHLKKHLEIRAIPRFDSNNQQVGLLHIVRDISERKKFEHDLLTAKEKAEESDRLKSAFLANMSHEIRTPMNGILGFAELLKEPELAGEKRAKYIRIIEKSGARMLNIINDIIDISKIESGQMVVSMSVTNVNEQLDFIYMFFRPEVEQKGIQFLCKKSLSSTEAILNTDREKLYAILTNLVKNALKFTQEGVIEFGYTVNERGKHLQFFVKDTGPGVRPEQKTVIFERFRQGSVLLTRNYEGAGLGLSITKAYVEMLGGRIWVESEEGAGSAFYFNLPFYKAANNKVSDHPHTSGDLQKIRKGTLKVLIAEDDDISEKLVSMVINPFAKEILRAITGVQAVEMCRNHSDLDLVLMDLKMPVMDGYEATRQIRQFNPGVVIIAQTAYALTGDREKALEAGCNDYIAKPFKKEALLNLLKKYFLME